ncbi:MAG: hypothetical protein RLO01_19780 [Thalassobaculaceae bacterium]
MKNHYAAVLVAAIALWSGELLAADDNFNTTAYKDGGTTGSTNANCSSAIAWWCEVVESTEVVQAAPGPMVGWLPVVAIAVAAAALAAWRR